MNAGSKEKFAYFYSVQLAEYRQRFLSWYRGQDARQQGLLALLAFITAATVLFFCLWQPVQARLANAERYYRDQQELYAWISENSATIKTGATASPASGQTMTTNVNKSAEKFNLKIDQLTADKQNSVHVSLNNIHFAPLIQWLNDLEKEYNIYARNVTITPEGAPLNINASLDLSY